MLQENNPPAGGWKTIKKCSKAKALAINTSVVIIAAFVVFFVFEAAVRVFIKPVYPIMRNDPRVGIIHQKNFRDFVWNDESKSENFIITNSLGYMGSDISIQKDEGVTRIAVIGDSMTEGLQVDYYKNFTVRLEHALNAATNRRFEVANYGVGGTGTFLQYQTYKKNVASYSLDVVVLIFGMNDYTDNLSKANLDVENYENVRSKTTVLKKAILMFQLPKFLFSKLQHNIAFLKILNKLGLYEFNETYLETFFKDGIQKLQERPEFFDYTFELIKIFRKRVEADGAKFFLIILPDEDSYLKSDGWRSNEKITKLAEFLNTEGIVYAHPAEFFVKERAVLKKCLTTNCNGHLNEFGHEVFAKFLFGFVQKHILY